MFKKELSRKLLKMMDEKKMTVEQLAEAADISRKFMSNIISEKQTPTLTIFEKICSALELAPNDLLLSEASQMPDKSKPKRVTQILCRKTHSRTDYYSICPGCNVTLEREYQAYCDRCGQKLSWKYFSKAEVIYKMQDK